MNIVFKQRENGQFTQHCGFNTLLQAYKRETSLVMGLAFSLPLSPFSDVVVQIYQLWWALLSSPYGFQLVELTNQIAVGHMKAAYLVLPVRKSFPEEFVANPQTDLIMLSEGTIHAMHTPHSRYLRYFAFLPKTSSFLNIYSHMGIKHQG